MFSVSERYLPDVPAAAGYFNADDFAAIAEINSVVINLTFDLTVLHNFFTLSYIVSLPQI